MSSTKDSEERETQDAYDRANSYAMVWLNDVFRFRDSPMRLFKSGTRLGMIDIVWMLVLFGVSLGVLFGIRSILKIDAFLFDPVVIIALSLILGWVAGRRMAHISPLRRQTGEGTSVWVKQKSKQLTSILRSKVGAGETYNVVQTWVNGELRNFPAREWLGTLPARRAPSYDSHDENETAYVELEPRGEQGIWR